MEVRFIKRTPEGMVVYDVDGKTTCTTPGSYVEGRDRRLTSEAPQHRRCVVVKLLRKVTSALW